LSSLYAESSAVLRWLLGAWDADRIERRLATAPAVVTSELTSAEVGRSLQRLVATGQVDPRRARVRGRATRSQVSTGMSTVWGSPFYSA
jgi:hypothetical protein